DARYRSSSLISGHRPLLGARAPDGELRDARGNTLWRSDLCNRDAVLVCFDDGQLPGCDTSELRLLLADVPHLLVVRIFRNVAPDCEHVLHEESYSCVSTRLWTDWRARHALIALGRPDGHIGWSARQPARETLATGVKKALGIASRPA
ncbi:MAG: hypothetical protein H7X91_02800, partial [Burkholderiales bacterium]|nr:hypothetical protein [Burkholderiales bacterium]